MEFRGGIAHNERDMDKKTQQDKFGSRFIVGRKEILDARLDLNTRSKEKAKPMDFGSVEKWMLPADSVVSVAPDTPLLHAHEMMTKQQLPALSVTENGRLLGVITLETAENYLSTPSQTAPSDGQIRQTNGQTAVRDIMETNPTTVSPTVSIKKAAKTMLAAERDDILVVDQDERWLGMLRLEDILHMVARS